MTGSDRRLTRCWRSSPPGALALTLAALLVLLAGDTAAAQTRQQKPRRQFISISVDRLHTFPLHFGKWPVEQLVGREVAEAQREPYDYHSRDGLTTVDVLEFRRRGRGVGVTVYPLGMSVGATLGLRGSREDLPVIRMDVSGPAAVANYVLLDAQAYDGSVGIYVADRAPGWGLGSHAFLAAGAGVVRSNLGDGRRVFAEGGGGLSVGPVGVQIACKFALNRLTSPISHQFMTVPITVRGSLSF
jgi:hypothetical protein